MSAAAGARPLLLGLAFAASYVLLDWVSFIHPLQQYGITPWNPQPALAIALLMFAGQRWLPLVAAAAAAAEVLVRGAPAGPFATLLFAGVLALCYAAIARALTGRFVISPELRSRRDVVRLVAVVTVGALVTGFLYIGVLLATGLGPAAQPFAALVRFWIGDAVGILVTLPVVFMLAVPARRAQLRELLDRRALFDALFLAGTLVVVFTRPVEQQLRFFYALFLPLVWLATRHGMAGAGIATLAIQMAVIVVGEAGSYPALTIFELQSLLMALAVTGLFLGVTVDERARAERELRHSMRMRAAGEMAAALAHELNQPLTSLTTYARALRIIAESPERDMALLARTVPKLVDEAERAAEVVRRLRDFFRTGATQLAPLRLEEAAARAVAALAERAAAADVALRLEGGARAPVVEADAVQLDIVLRNLLGNAIEAAAAAAPPRSVRVALDWDAQRLRADVLDSGPGVPPADVERVFEPFETTRASGMGMGLAISRAIIEAHGGALWAEPGPPGHFRFTLPLRHP